MFIDTHCHLQLKEYEHDRALVIGNAKKSGVKKIVVPGVNEFSNRLAVDLAKKMPGTIFAAIGFHPYEASQEYDLTQLETSEPVIAIGEIGLDYHLFKGEAALGKKQQQIILFESQLTIALQRNLPVIMHCRDAFEDFFLTLDKLPKMPRGVIHCFSGGIQEIRMAQERKLYVGIDGNCTYSRQLQSIIPSIPLHMILLETDAPYLTPVPHRGIRNEPKYIPLIAQTIADLLKVSPNTIKNQTTTNAETLFSL